MDFPGDDKIKQLCEDALVLTDRYGVHKGLAFLIGLKFHAVLQKLKDAQNRVGPPCGEPRKARPEALAGDTSLLDDALPVQRNFMESTVKIRGLETIRDTFIKEIKDTFDINDIEDYLNSWPRLGFDEGSPFPEGGISQKVAPFTTQEVLLEVEDIFCVEKMKKLFS